MSELDENYVTSSSGWEARSKRKETLWKPPPRAMPRATPAGEASRKRVGKMSVQFAEVSRKSVHPRSLRSWKKHAKKIQARG